MLKILRYLRLKEWLMTVPCVLFIVLQVFLELKIPDYTQAITQLIQTPGTPMTEIWAQGGYMLLCALGSAVSAIVTGYFAAKIAAGLSRRLRRKVFDKVESFSMEEINRFSTASLITRSTNDITQVQMIVAMGLQVMIKAPIMAAWAIVKILGKSWQLSAATAVVVAIMLLMIIVVVLLATPKFKKIQAMTDDINRITRENLTGVRVVRAYNAEGYQEEKFSEANEKLTKNHLFTGRLMAVMNPGMNILMQGLTLSIYLLSAFIVNALVGVDAKMVAIAEMTAFSQIAMQVIMSFMMLTMIFIMLPRASVSAKRIAEVLEVQPTICDGAGIDLDSAETGTVEFKNVSFKYPDAEEYVLKDISFRAEKGETVAFIGSTGSGKSTLINLIPRFYDVTEGEVLVDGHDVREYKLSDLYNRLGYVPQRGVLFSGTVSSNIDYGKGPTEIGEQEIKDAVEVAKAKDFVEAMSGGYAAPIAQGGTNVSGGQKQRLSIARAVARNPEIYIFDDTFSALDYKTDKELRAALKAKTKDATSIIVAQRIGTIRNADRIVVLDEGKMAGIGTHDELMKSCSVYQEIAYSQLSKEELQ